MISKDRIDYQFIYTGSSFTPESLVALIKGLESDFIPYKMLGEEKVFDEESFIEILNLNLNYQGVLIEGKNGEKLIFGSYHQNRLVPRGVFSGIYFNGFNKSLDKSKLTNLLGVNGFKIGFKLNQLYNFSQSEDDPQRYYPTWGLDSSKLPKYFNEQIFLERIDISKNPGRERFLPGMKFIPGYKIWYGKESQELFGREKILQYSNAIKIDELENGVIEMQLMDDITKCDSRKNQERQGDIVKYLGIDKMEVSKY